jgi:hypothetical protein
MPIELARRPASIIGWPVAFIVTLQIDPTRVADDTTVGIVAIRLVNMSEKFVDWKPNQEWRPAIARFEFSSPVGRDRFIADATRIPGVSVVMQ